MSIRVQHDHGAHAQKLHLGITALIERRYGVEKVGELSPIETVCHCLILLRSQAGELQAHAEFQGTVGPFRATAKT